MSKEVPTSTKRFESKWIVLIVGLLLVAVFATVLTYPKKYKVGMSWDEVVTLAKPERLELYGTGLETEGLSSKRLETEIVFTTYDPRAGLYIELNNQTNVIRVQRWKYFGVNFAELLNKFKKQ